MKTSEADSSRRCNSLMAADLGPDGHARPGSTGGCLPGNSPRRSVSFPAGFRPSSRNPHKPITDMQFNQIVSAARQELSQTKRETSMEAIGLLVTLEARAGKEADAEAFLKSAQPLAQDEA